MTPRFDRISLSFIKKIPTTFKTVFVPGTLMPDTHVIKKEVIADYVNRAMMKLFNQKWEESKGRVQLFISIFPELAKFTGELSGSVGFEGTAYQIATPYLDFFKIVGAIGSDNQFIKVWDEDKFAIALSGEYQEYTATPDNPAIIQMHKILFVFPPDMTDFSFKIVYVGQPLSSATGEPFTQNSDQDSPFSDQWNDKIADIAYDLYLQESYETT